MRASFIQKKCVLYFIFIYILPDSFFKEKWDLKTNNNSKKPWNKITSEKYVLFVTARDWLIVCSCFLVAKLKRETQLRVEINISIKLKQMTCTQIFNFFTYFISGFVESGYYNMEKDFVVTKVALFLSSVMNSLIS